MRGGQKKSGQLQGDTCGHGAQRGGTRLRQAGKRRAAAVMGNSKHLRAAGQNECSLPPRHLSIPWMSGAHDSNAQAICGEKKVDAGTAVWDWRALLTACKPCFKGGCNLSVSSTHCRACPPPPARRALAPDTASWPVIAVYILHCVPRLPKSWAWCLHWQVAHLQLG